MRDSGADDCTLFEEFPAFHCRTLFFVHDQSSPFTGRTRDSIPSPHDSRIGGDEHAGRLQYSWKNSTRPPPMAPPAAGSKNITGFLFASSTNKTIQPSAGSPERTIR